MTWRQTNDGWKCANMPKWDALARDLRNRNPNTETMHTQIHNMDLQHPPLSGPLKWLIEFPPEWR